MSEVSQKIVEAMKRKGVSLERLEIASGVSERHIISIVEGNAKKLPAAPYLRGYLLKIGKAIDLDGEELWRELSKERETIRRAGAEDRLPEGAPWKKRGNMKMAAMGVGTTLIVFAILIQIFRSDNPGIKFENLNEEITETKERIFMVQGKLNPSFKLMLGEEEIVIKEEGAFEKEVILEPGFNTLIFVAKKPLGKEHKFPKQIFYEEAPSVEPSPETRIPEIAPDMAPPAPEVIQ